MIDRETGVARPGDRSTRKIGGSQIKRPLADTFRSLAIVSHFDKGVLHLTIKKPAKAVKTTKKIDIKTGAPPSQSPVSPAAPSKAA